MNEGEESGLATEEPMGEAFGFSAYAQALKSWDIMIQVWHEIYGHLPHEDRRAIIIRAFRSYGG